MGASAMEEMAVLDGQAVHVWWCGVAALERPGVRAACHHLMNAEETARHDRFLVERVRDEFLLTRGLCRSVLSRYAPVAPEAWTFETNPFGRPHVLAPALPAPLHFNLSNTQGMAAMAVTRLGYEVGVDVENVERIADAMALAQRNFSPREAAALAQHPEGTSRQRAFFALWTLKEAYIKARGMGMSIPLEQFSIDIGVSPPRLEFEADVQDDGTAWQLALHTPTQKHLLALAIRRGTSPDAVVTVREGLAF